MKYLDGKTKREKFLIIGLIGTLIFGGYLMTRVKSLNSNLEKIKENIVSEKKKNAKLKNDIGDIKPSKVIEKEITALQKKIDKEKAALKGLDLDFVDLNNHEALHKLLSDVTLTAEKYNLQILSKENEFADLKTLLGKDNQVAPKLVPGKKIGKAQKRRISQFVAEAKKNNTTLKRRMFKLKLRGTFQSTYEFIQALHNMEHSVLIARLKLNAEDNNTFQGVRLISTNLTLAL
jgi:cell division protein FtsL